MLAFWSMNAAAVSASFALDCHPRTPSSALRGVDVTVGESASGSLTLMFGLAGDLSGLRIPDSRPSRRAGDLWRHTCLEVFVMGGEGPGYREFNFSPSGEWMAYDFHAYRDGGALEVDLQPGIRVRKTGDRLELDAEIRRDFLPSDRPLRLGLSAVVEDARGALSYWALQHPPGKPDFHHTDGFALEMESTRLREHKDPVDGVWP
jgi:hypothetical protein